MILSVTAPDMEIIKSKESIDLSGEGIGVSSSGGDGGEQRSEAVRESY